MKKVRKIVDISKLKDWTNVQLSRTDDYATQEFKAGIFTAVSNTLHATGQYNGFQHLYWMNGGCEEWYKAGEPDFPEKNRFIYGEGGKEQNEYNRFIY